MAYQRVDTKCWKAECFGRIDSHFSGTIGIMEASDYLVIHSIVVAMIGN